MAKFHLSDMSIEELEELLRVFSENADFRTRLHKDIQEWLRVKIRILKDSSNAG